MASLASGSLLLLEPLFLFPRGHGFLGLTEKAQQFSGFISWFL